MAAAAAGVPASNANWPSADFRRNEVNYDDCDDCHRFHGCCADPRVFHRASAERLVERGCATAPHQRGAQRDARHDRASLEPGDRQILGAGPVDARSGHCSGGGARQIRGSGDHRRAIGVQCRPGLLSGDESAGDPQRPQVAPGDERPRSSATVIGRPFRLRSWFQAIL